ncbi:MAG: ATP synthase F1 subunit epsilon [Faecousia sp.]
MSGFRLQIVTTEGSLFDGEAEALRLRTSEGYVSIRAGHADYIAALDIGMVTVTQNGKSRNAACGGGFLSVEKGEVRLVATTFEYAEDIDAERAEQAKKRAEERLAEAKEEKDILLAKAKLSRALNRLAVVKE